MMTLIILVGRTQQDFYKHEIAKDIIKSHEAQGRSLAVGHNWQYAKLPIRLHPGWSTWIDNLLLRTRNKMAHHLGKCAVPRQINV